jgi:hypothetical protein
MLQTLCATPHTETSQGRDSPPSRALGTGSPNPLTPAQNAFYLLVLASMQACNAFP